MAGEVQQQQVLRRCGRRRSPRPRTGSPAPTRCAVPAPRTRRPTGRPARSASAAASCAGATSRFSPGSSYWSFATTSATREPSISHVRSGVPSYERVDQLLLHLVGGAGQLDHVAVDRELHRPPGRRPGAATRAPPSRPNRAPADLAPARRSAPRRWRPDHPANRPAPRLRDTARPHRTSSISNSCRSSSASSSSRASSAPSSTIADPDVLAHRPSPSPQADASTMRPYRSGHKRRGRLGFGNWSRRSYVGGASW